MAQASAGTKAPDLLYFYTAYQIDYQTNGGKTTLAPSCVGKPCTLLQFAQETMWEPNLEKFNTGVSGLSAANKALLTTTTPDILNVVLLLKSQSWFLGIYNGGSLNANYDNTKPLTQFAKAVSDAADVVQTCRQKVTDGSLDPLVTKVQTAFSIANENRIADQMTGGSTGEGGIVDQFETWASATKYVTSVETTTKTTADGRSYTEIDTFRTISESGITPGSANAQKVINWITKFVNPAVKTTVPAQREAIRHQQILNTMQLVHGRINGPSSC